MRVGLDQLPDREAIGGFAGRDGDVLTQWARVLAQLVLVAGGNHLEIVTWFENATVAQARAAFTRSGVMGSKRSRRPVA